jgi:hypothetical protein
MRMIARKLGVNLSPTRSDIISLLALGLVWIGVWGPWIPHRVSSLTLNAVDLAEWSAVLTDVRAGPLHAAPDQLRLGIALAVVALAVAAAAIRQNWQRWLVRLIALLPGLVLLPPYPQVLQLWRSDAYGARFLVALLIWVGVAASLLTDLLPEKGRQGLLILLCGLAVGFGGSAFMKLTRPFEAHYASPISPGWGVVTFTAGLLVVVLLQGMRLLGIKTQTGQQT